MYLKINNFWGDLSDISSESATFFAITNTLGVQKPFVVPKVCSIVVRYSEIYLYSSLASIEYPILKIQLHKLCQKGNCYRAYNSVDCYTLSRTSVNANKSVALVISQCQQIGGTYHQRMPKHKGHLVSLNTNKSEARVISKCQHM